MTDITTAKRTMAAASLEAARLLGAGVSRPCAQTRYNMAAQTALADETAQLSDEERRLIASFIEPEEDEPRTFILRVRLSEQERDRLDRLASEAGMSMSEYVRDRALV